MGRVIVTAIIAAAVVVAIFWSYNMSQQKQLADDQTQIAQLQQQIKTLQDQNAQLKAQLEKVQAEEQILAGQNEGLNKAIAEFKATGKMPKLPYPPK